jgi:hypothetical protein
MQGGMKLQGTLPLIGDPQAGQRANSVVDDLDETITDIHRAIFDLQARGTPTPAGLHAKVAQVVDEMAGPLSLSPALELPGDLDGRVPDDIGNECCTSCGKPSPTPLGTATPPASR